MQYIYDKFLEALKNVPNPMFEKYLSPDVLKNKNIEYEESYLVKFNKFNT